MASPALPLARSSRNLPTAIRVMMRTAVSKYVALFEAVIVTTTEYTKATVEPSETRVSILTVLWRAALRAPRWKIHPTHAHTGVARPSCTQFDQLAVPNP